MANEGRTKPNENAPNRLTLTQMVDRAERKMYDMMLERDAANRELARVRGLLQRQLMAAGEISPEICECGCPKFTHNPCCLSESAEGICQCDGFRQRGDVDMKRGIIFDRNGGEHKQEQTCPQCASVFYDKNFAICPVCKNGLAYVVKPFCPAGKKDCPCHTFVPADEQGAESADIGKLDGADESGKVNRVEYDAAFLKIVRLLAEVHDAFESPAEMSKWGNQRIVEWQKQVKEAVADARLIFDILPCEALPSLEQISPQKCPTLDLPEGFRGQRCGNDEMIAKEIRNPWATSPPEKWPSIWAAMRVYGDGRWGMMCASTARADCEEAISHQVNRIGNSAHIFRIVEFRVSETLAKSSEARPGVEGAHEGTTADKSGSREPEKLNNAQKVELCDKCGFPKSEYLHNGTSSSDPYHKFVALAESSLSPPPPKNCTKCGLPSWYDVHNMQRINVTNAHHFVAASPELLPTQLPKEK